MSTKPASTVVASVSSCCVCRPCSGENPVKDQQWINWRYEQPAPLSAGKALIWRPPDFKRPGFCDQLDERNAKFVAMPNHPCNWMAWPDVPGHREMLQEGPSESPIPGIASPSP